eukprot:Clim_evm22s22 gene=Clim_evmTU22s22
MATKQQGQDTAMGSQFDLLTAHSASSFTDSDQGVSLEVKHILKGLSQFGKTVGGAFAFKKVDLQGNELTDVIILEEYEHLEHINLRDNLLRDLRTLQSITHLLIIDASGNKIESLQAVPTLLSLVQLDLSSNMITGLENISRFSSLRTLDLSSNGITSIDELKECNSLETLILDNNRLRNLGNIELPGVQTLSVRNNAIQSFVGLENFPSLNKLTMSDNGLRSVKTIVHGLACPLVDLDLAANDLNDVTDLTILMQFPSLNSLKLEGNPICSMPSYPASVLCRLERLSFMDGSVITEKSRVRVQNEIDPPLHVLLAVEHANRLKNYIRRPIRIHAHDLNDSLSMYRPIVLAGPMGAGKSVLMQQLVERHPEGFEITNTYVALGKKPDADTADASDQLAHEGQHVHFVEDDEMRTMIDKGVFVRTAAIAYRTFSGISVDDVEEIAGRQKHALIECDLEGVQLLKRTYLNAFYVLIMPPSSAVQELRLRGKMDGEVQELALKVAKANFHHDTVFDENKALFDLHVVNHESNEAYRRLFHSLAHALLLEKCKSRNRVDCPQPTQGVSSATNSGPSNSATLMT